MATTRKILGQATTTAGGFATLYTVPASTDAVVSSIVVCETGGATATFTIAVDAAGGTGATPAGKCIAKTVAIAANGVVTLSLGITLAAAATIVISCSTTTVTVTAFGQENT